jgi:hypothetical protein
MDITDNNDDELFRALGAVLNGRPIDAVIPALIVAVARALSTEANGDVAQLARMLIRFNKLVADQAFDMALPP